MAAPIRYRLLPGTAGKAMVDAAVFTPKGMTALVRRVTEKTRTAIVKKAHVGHSGALRGGYVSEMKRANTISPIGIVANPIIYHDAADEGRKAGKRPPIDALVPWVGSKLGIPPGPERQSVAFLVARKIGQKGTEGSNAVEEGWDEVRKEIKPEMKALGLRIVGKLKT